MVYTHVKPFALIPLVVNSFFSYRYNFQFDLFPPVVCLIFFDQ